jgi:hypothetical protein
VFDFLHAAGWIVPDPERSARRFAEVFGLPPFREEWVQRLPSHGYEAVFMRTGSSLGAAPTRVEFITRVEPDAEACSVAPIDTLARWQRRRPQRNHATVLCVEDPEQLADDLRRRSVPVWTEPGCAHMAHARRWIGWLDGGRLQVPVHDGGLVLEFLETAALGRRVVASVAAPPPEPLESRLDRRVHLVADVEAVVRTVERTLALEPAEPIAVDAVLGGRRAQYRFRHPAGAALELVEPAGDGPARRYLERWGEGPWLTTVRVDAPDAVVAGVRERGGRVDAELAGRGAVVVEVPELPGLLAEVASL